MIMYLYPYTSCDFILTDGSFRIPCFRPVILRVQQFQKLSLSFCRQQQMAKFAMRNNEIKTDSC